jgi:hypothetical protein
VRAHWQSSIDRGITIVFGIRTYCASVDGSNSRLAGRRLVEDGCTSLIRADSGLDVYNGETGLARCVCGY